MEQIFRTVLLLALPASGKSEVRNLMTQMDAGQRKEDFHIGPNLQLDDYPYVHMMRRIDEELERIGEERIFYKAAGRPFRDERDWGTLIMLLNEDFADLKNGVRVSPASDAAYLMERIDRASVAAGLPARISLRRAGVREAVATALEEEAKKLRTEKEAQYTDTVEGKTIIIECARGGPDGAKMPLKGAFGYQYSLPLLSPALLDEAAILFIRVTPEESRRKNNERARPEDPGSNLFHGVPMEVMLGEYGCDDMQYLLEHAERTGTVTVKRDGRTWHVPVGVFDNRVDKTSFLRGEKETWDADRVREVTDAIREATDHMWALYGDNAVEHFTDVEVVEAGEE